MLKISSSNFFGIVDLLTNYVKESLTCYFSMITAVHTKKAYGLLYGRFVNTHGLQGKNI